MHAAPLPLVRASARALSPLFAFAAFAAFAALAGCDTPVADAGPLFNREAWHHVDDPSLIDDDFEYVLDELPTSGEAKQVPTLRRVSLHPPYMHDGRAKTLEAAIQDMVTTTKNTTASDADVAAMAAYLRTL